MLRSLRFSVVGIPFASGVLASLFLFGPDVVQGFTFPLPQPARQGHAIRRDGIIGAVLFSEPSDSASDDEAFWDDEIVDIETDVDFSGEESSGSGTTTTAPARNLMELMPRTAVSEVSAETRAAINEAIVNLEKVNPTAQPTVSPLLNGVWTLQYSGGYEPQGALASPTRQLALFLYSGGYSPALFVLAQLQKLLPVSVLDLENLEISISRSQPRVEGTLKFSIGPNKAFAASAKVVSRLETMSEVRLKETYESAVFQDLQSITIPEFLQYSRDLYVTYVDEDLLIVRDASGVPEVLVRKEFVGKQNWGSEPSDLDDMKAPGEE